jgi:hypothetical protein
MAAHPKPVRRRKQRDRITEDTVAAVHARSGGWCECSPGCLRRAEVLHHRQLRSQGGTHLPENIAHLSEKCHRWVHENPAEAAERGLIVRRTPRRDIP